MSGDRQTPGSVYDPAPQFAVHEVEGSDADGLVAVTGRCWFGLIVLGTTFRRLVSLSDEAVPSGTAVPCVLRVERIALYGRPVEDLSQTVSASLLLDGERPAQLRGGLHSERLLLVAEPSSAWTLLDGMWHRSVPPGPDERTDR